MGDADSTRTMMDSCTVDGCPGHYERRGVTHTVRHEGQLVVIDHVPADVCTICGDVLFSPETIRVIEQMLSTRSQPSGSAPIYEFRKAG
jgi:YgiT-type zinc finger domain-containing protein